MKTQPEKGKERGGVRQYFVFSPEHETQRGGWYDPPEYGCDVVQIEAESKRDALILGVSVLLKERKSWASQNRLDGLPPWTGYRVEEIPEDEQGGGRRDD